MLKSPMFRRLVLGLMVVAAVVIVGEGCAKKKRRKKKKDYKVPTQEEISRWRDRLRNSDHNMAVIPAGRYQLGDNTFVGNRKRFVKLEAPFKIDKFEVANHDWWMFLFATNKSQDYFAAPPVVMGDYDTDKWAQGHKYFKYDYDRAKHPIRAIGYDEAQMFCKFVRKRLPTADEWEIAARGPEGLRYPWGNKYSSAYWKTKAQTSFMMSIETTGRADSSSIIYRHDTVAVDSMPEGQSPFGLYHMGGNVSEWTTSQVTTGHGEWKKVKRSERPKSQVVKGGSFYSRQKGSLAAQYFDLLPNTASDVFRVGFRCARD